MLRRAELLLEQRRPQEAEEVIHDYLIGEPDDVAAHVLLVQALIHQDRPKAALRVADHAVALEPTWSHTHWARGSALMELKALKAAGECADAAIQLEPEDPDNYALSAQIYARQRNWPEAIAAARTGLSFDPNHSVCRHVLSQSLGNTGEKGMARESLLAGLANNPLDPDAHVQVGFQALRSGQNERALEAFEEALRLDAEHEGAREGLVEALKARNPIYSVILRGFLKLNSLPDKVALYLLVGFFILHRIARSLRKDHPEWEWFLDPITWAYIAFVIITWFADSLFDLLLLGSREGRMALVGPSRQRALAFGASLVLVAICASFAVVQQDVEWMWVGFLVLMAQVPVVAGFTCSRPGARRVMLGIAGVCNIFVLLGVSIMFIHADSNHQLGLMITAVGGIGGALSSWLGIGFLLRER